MNKRGGLGRGLAALIPTGPAPAEQAAPERSVAPDRGDGHAPVPTVTLVPAPAPTPESAPDALTVVPEDGGALGVPGARLLEVAVDDVVPNPKQPRLAF